MEGLNKLVKALRLLYVPAEIRSGCLQHSRQNRHRLDQHSVSFLRLVYHVILSQL